MPRMSAKWLNWKREMKSYKRFQIRSTPACLILLPHSHSGTVHRRRSEVIRLFLIVGWAHNQNISYHIKPGIAGNIIDIGQIPGFVSYNPMTSDLRLWHVHVPTEHTRMCVFRFQGAYGIHVPLINPMSVCLSVYLSICLSFYLYLSIYLSMHASFHCVCVCMCAYVCVCMCAYVCVCVSADFKEPMEYTCR